MSHMVVNKMGPSSRMLIRWVCPNQQMVTFQTRETTNGTTRYLNHINRFADQQDGPTTHIVVSGPISLFLLSRKHKMGCANCIALLKTFSSRAKETGGRWKSVKQGSAGFQYRATKRKMGDSKILLCSLFYWLYTRFTPVVRLVGCHHAWNIL